MALDLLLGFMEMADFGLKAAAQRARTRNLGTVAWDRAATTLGTARASDPQNDGWPRIVAEVDGFKVTIDCVGDVDGKTRVRATSTAPNHERLKIYAADSFAPLARAVGVQDVVLGDKAFDKRFMVKGNDEQFTRMWVNATVRKRVSRVPEYQFELRNRRVVATKVGLETDAAKLVRAARAVAALAHGRQRVMRNWAKLKRRYGGKLRTERDRWVSFRGKHDGAAFTIDTYEYADRHFTTVTARVEKGRLPACIVAHERHHVSTTLPRNVHLERGTAYRWFSEAPERAAALLGESPIRTLADAGITKLAVEPEQVRVFVPGICIHAKKLEKLIALACRISQGSAAGPYR